MEPLRVLDLFSGAGAFSLGLERSGLCRTVAFSEIDATAIAVLAKHWPQVPVLGDVRALCRINADNDNAEECSIHEGQDFGECACIGLDQFLDEIGPVDAICGGFPCQDLSLAGKGVGLSGDRSGLWREFARIIRVLRPRFVFVENVAALLGRGLGDVLGDLAALGYDCEWHCIPASYVGAPHDRDRVWIIANAQRGERRHEPYLRPAGRVGRQLQSVPWDRPWEVALRQFRGVDDGTAYRVHRVDLIRNGLVPQIPELIGRAILSTLGRQAA